MASRRSRLQIKPNILNGPKVSNTKPVQKPPLSKSPVPKSPVPKSAVPNSPVASSGQEKAPVDRLHAGNKVKSPTRGTSPRKNIIVNTFNEADGDKVVSVTDNVSINTADAETVLDAKVGSDTTSDAASLPTRGRLRKFGKVNIGAARGAKADSLLSKDTITAENKGKSDIDGSNEGSATDVAKKEDDRTEIAENTEKKSSDDVSGSGNVPFPRRSRFPKAKPNIADAGRRRIKEATTKEEASRISRVTDVSSEIPEIIVTDVTASIGDPRASLITAQPSESSQTLKSEQTQPSKSFQTMISNHPQPSDCSQTTKPDGMPVVDSFNASLSVPDSGAKPVDGDHALTLIQPKPSTSSTIVTKSLLKTPIPTIPVSPEKRARTLSTSESTVVKRQRKPKVEAPTDQPPDRSTMKMKDLVRWNPTNNPMKIKTKEGKPITGGVEKENVDNRKMIVNSVVVVEERATEAPDTALPVPQVTIGPDGNIVINEKSLVLKDPELEKAPSQEDDVIDETDMYTTYGSFRKKKLSKRWTKKETKKFYKGLAMIGIDFFLINRLFPNRSRFEIKKKFKKEEKVNRSLVEKVLTDGIKFDPTVFDAQDEESSDEELVAKKEKKEKTRRKKTGGKNDKEIQEQQNTAKKKPVKRKKVPLNYYEDDTSEEELPCKIASNREDSPWKPPSVSQKDGEVVGILMDMSEGRLTADGQLPENVMDMNAADGTEKLIAVPFNKHNNSGKFIPMGDTNVTTNSGLTAPQCSSTGVHNIPEIQRIGLNVGDTGWKNKQIKLPVTTVVNRQSSLVNQNNSDTSNRRIYLPTFNKKDSTVSQSNIQTNIQHDVNLYNTAVQYEPGYSENNAIAVTSQLEQGIGSNQLQPVSMAPVIGCPDNSEDPDQYVLVTVMPEGGGETVIHIYRLHGGAQSQDEPVLYSDQYAPALTQEYTDNNDVVPVSITQTDMQEMSADEIPVEIRHETPPVEMSSATGYTELMTNESNSVDSTSNFISNSDDLKAEIYINSSEMMVNEPESIPQVENC